MLFNGKMNTSLLAHENSLLNNQHQAQLQFQPHQPYISGSQSAQKRTVNDSGPTVGTAQMLNRYY